MKHPHVLRAGGVVLLSGVIIASTGRARGEVPSVPAGALPGALPGVVSPVTPIAPPRLPSVAPGLGNAPPVAPSELPDVSRDVTDVSIVGATAYPARTLDAVIAGLAGPAVPQQRIEDARAGLVNLYRGDGYIATTVQAVLSNGHLRFVVTEGRIVEVRLDGDIGPAATQVLQFLNHLTEVQPLTVAALERWLLLANDVPGVTVRSVLNPSSGDPGALTLVAQVSRKPVTGLFTSDNRAFRQTGPEEMLAIVDFNSFSQYGERTEAQIYHTYDDTQTFGQASSEFFVGSSGLKARVYGGAGTATPSGDLRAIGYNASTTIFGSQVSYPAIRERAQSFNVLGMFDALETSIDTGTGTGPNTTQTQKDSLRVLRAQADYSLLDTWLGESLSATNGISGRISQGLHLLGASGNGRPDATRLNEVTDFTKFVGQISRAQALFVPWDDAAVAIQGIAAGQGTGAVLPPAEKFYLGGPHFNRGYYYGQVTGDSAVSTTIELQLNTPLPLPSFVPSTVTTSAQFYLFYDWGQVWQNQKLDADQTLRSTGGGVRLFVTEFTEFDIEGVARLTRYPNGSSGNVSAIKSGALYWQALARF